MLIGEQEQWEQAKIYLFCTQHDILLTTNKKSAQPVTWRDQPITAVILFVFKPLTAGAAYIRVSIFY